MAARNVLIASGAYADAQLQAEFGAIPPAFLPLDGARLFHHQQRVLGPRACRVFLSLPADFAIPPGDAAALAAAGITMLAVPPGLSLGASLAHAITAGGITGRLGLLHGDTLLDGLDLAQDDAVSVAPMPPAYRWGRVALQGGRITPLNDDAAAGADDAASDILTGWFAFADAADFNASLAASGLNFIAALQHYSAQHPMTPLRAARWLDFGHADTFYQSRRAATAARAFNQVQIGRRAVEKTSDATAKIAAERHWYENLPAGLRGFTPAYLGALPRGYRLEYLHLPSLSEVAVFGRLGRRGWQRIFTACEEVLTAMAAHPAPPGSADPAALYLEKTLIRLEAFSAARKLNLNQDCRLDGMRLPPLPRIAAEMAALIPPATAAMLHLVHGDFCFSNLFHDTRAEMIRMIDPRGMDAAGQPSLYGDGRYDAAKLHHSAIGQYDRIMAGDFALTQHGDLDFALTLAPSPDWNAIAAAYGDIRPGAAHAPPQTLAAISVLLFLSMLPLHHDDARRQAALLANALRLFAGINPACRIAP